MSGPEGTDWRWVGEGILLVALLVAWLGTGYLLIRRHARRRSERLPGNRRRR
jgi:hypothetical protein